MFAKRLPLILTKAFDYVLRWQKCTYLPLVFHNLLIFQILKINGLRNDSPQSLLGPSHFRFFLQHIMMASVFCGVQYRDGCLCLSEFFDQVNEKPISSVGIEMAFFSNTAQSIHKCIVIASCPIVDRHEHVKMVPSTRRFDYTTQPFASGS